jgi:hypothetical protein
MWEKGTGGLFLHQDNKLEKWEKTPVPFSHVFIGGVIWKD